RCIAALAVALAVALAAAPAAAQRAPEGASGWTDRAAVEARRFIAATANPHATDAAYAMLARGGSAVDAAIAAQLVLGLVEPQSSGLGGGAFMLVHDAPSGRLHAYDGRETAPAAATPARFLTENGSPAKFDAVVAAGLSVGAPGLVLGLVEPQSSGLGGGAFMLVHDAPSGRLHAYDGRETAPAAATPARFLTENGSPAKFDAVVATGLTVGVPGLVRLLQLAHRK